MDWLTRDTLIDKCFLCGEIYTGPGGHSCRQTCFTCNKTYTGLFHTCAVLAYPEFGPPDPYGLPWPRMYEHTLIPPPLGLPVPPLGGPVLMSPGGAFFYHL